MTEPERDPVGKLRLEFAGRWELGELAAFLDALRYAYASILDFDSIDVDAHHRRFRHWHPEMGIFPDPVSALANPFTPRTVEEHRALVFQRLALDGEPDIVSIHSASPGWIELVAKLNPLVVVTEFIKWCATRREQAKKLELENEQREITNRKLSLENMLLENQVVSERLKTLREIGMTKKEQRAVLARDIATPLRQLEPFIERKGITASLFTEQDEKKSPVEQKPEKPSAT